MNRKTDIRMLAKAIRENWGITPERKRAYLAALDETIRNRDAIEDPEKRFNIAIQANRVLQMEQAAALKDLHQIEHDARLDAGLATERLSVVPRVMLRGLPDEDDTVDGAISHNDNNAINAISDENEPL
jgi:hypothetical protein